MFKEHIESDLSDVFVNTDEFGETNSINGVSVEVVEDKDHLEYKIRKDASGLLSGDMLFYISSTEYSKIPKVTKPPRTGEVIMYNSKPATICDVGNNEGLYEITVQYSGAR